MAGRTSSSVGVGVTVTLLAIATLGLFVTSVVFFSKSNAERKKFDTLNETMNDLVRQDERTSDAVAELKQLAQKDGRKSVMGYLLEKRSQLMQLASGSSRDSLEALKKKLEAFEGSGGQSMLAVIVDREVEIKSIKQQLADAEAAKASALQDRENEVKRVKGLDDSQKATLAALNAEIDKYKDEVDRMRADLNTAKGGMDESVQRCRSEAAAREAELNTRIETLERERVIDRSRIKRMEEERSGQRFTGQPESTLVDAQVIGMDAVENTVVVSIGRKQKVVLGMRFEVYSEATAIRPDEQTGEYPTGKAVLEVIKVDQDSAITRVVRQRKGNPIAKGDVIANPVFDPSKTYHFLVYGSFDTNGDGRFTPDEQTQIQARIEAWGGVVVNDLSGDLDFLVLGERPVLPPDPPGTAPIEQINEFVRLRRLAQRYDDLLSQATATSIPVINENRLRTLLAD